MDVDVCVCLRLCLSDFAALDAIRAQLAAQTQGRFFCLLLLNHCPDCDALEFKLKRQQRMYISLFFFSYAADAIFSSAPSDQAFNAARQHSDVLNMMNAEMRDVKAKHEHSIDETRG